MTHRIAASLALIAFALCLVVGGLQAGNPFSTTVLRALLALCGTYVIGLAVGAVGQRMIDENLKSEEEKLRNSRKLEGNDR
jgi:NhaP-type Na+/H+ or K+/H+ antiporter